MGALCRTRNPALRRWPASPAPKPHPTIGLRLRFSDLLCSHRHPICNSLNLPSLCCRRLSHGRKFTQLTRPIAASVRPSSAPAAPAAVRPAVLAVTHTGPCYYLAVTVEWSQTPAFDRAHGTDRPTDRLAATMCRPDDKLPINLHGVSRRLMPSVFLRRCS